MVLREKSITKLVLLQIKDWDSYQLLIRQFL